MIDETNKSRKTVKATIMIALFAATLIIQIFTHFSANRDETPANEHGHVETSSPLIPNLELLDQSEDTDFDTQFLVALQQQETHNPTDGNTNPLEQKLNFNHDPGCHTVASPVVGSRARELALIRQYIREDSRIRDLERAVYVGDLIYLIPVEQKDAADEVAHRLFSDYVTKYAEHGVTEYNAVQWEQSGMPGLISNKCLIMDVDNEWNTWRVQAVVEERHGEHNEKNGLYLPPHVVAFHELMHVEETPKRLSGAFNAQQWNGHELMTSVKTILLLDQVYKEINDIAIDAQVGYDKSIILGSKEIPLGVFANFYRDLESRHRNLAEALVSPESLSFISHT